MRRGQTIKTVADAEWMLDYLSTHFKCTQPDLVVEVIGQPKPSEISFLENHGPDHEPTAGLYHYPDELIIIGMLGWHGTDRTGTILHEFAHHLTRDPGHDEAFATNLIAVVTAWNGTPQKFNWSREYASVQVWARKLGIVIE